MRVLLTSEARFERTSDGTVWGAAACGRGLWSRYLEVFSEATVVARVSDVHAPSPGLAEASMPGVAFLPLPPYAGGGALLQHWGVVSRRVADGVSTCPAVIVRTPSAVAYLASRAACRARRALGAEVVGDPHDVFSPGAFEHPLRPLIRRMATAAQRRVAARAGAVLYVTARALQRRYPTGGDSYAVTDVALGDDAFAEGPVRGRRPSEPFALVTVAALDQPYKGIAVLLDAVRQLDAGGADLRLRIVGGGRLLPDLRQRAAALGLGGTVEFLGQQDRPAVRAALDSADLFVLPSLQEGMPRALLEAMARGLPAVATTVGGVPEVLPPDCLAAPRDSAALAARIGRLMADEALRLRRAEENRQTARRCHERIVTGIRRQFLERVRDSAAAGGGHCHG